MKKRIAVFLSCVMILGLVAGCSDSTPSPSPSPSGSAPVEETPEAEDEDTPPFEIDEPTPVAALVPVEEKPKKKD